MTNDDKKDTPIIVWFRLDLRTHDHPALHTAIQESDEIIPVYIFDEDEISGPTSSSNRNRFLLESLTDLKESLKKAGGDLVIRHGDAKKALVELADETGAKSVYYTAEYSPSSLKRDKNIEEALSSNGIEARSFGGYLAVSSLQKLLTKTGTEYKVFTPFWKTWSEVVRRDVVPAPKVMRIPKVDLGTLPNLKTISNKDELSADVVRGGEMEARSHLHAFLDGPIDDYRADNNDMGKEGTSKLSPYLHFGCVSVREIETLLPDSEGARSWHRQLAWRDFYHYILFHFPHPEREFQERYRNYQWSKRPQLLNAWKEGQTGYPAVDAAMRQLKKEGWMHNRGRLIVGSFLTKDLGIDWREGERYFMKWLLDGDTANNNGNWQWIASVGVDPAPLFRRLYNPSSQRDRYDPEGVYVRTYIPELKLVPDKYLSEPWKMSIEDQHTYRCIIGKDYPAPIVDHKEARAAALERYRSV